MPTSSHSIKNLSIPIDPVFALSTFYKLCNRSYFKFFCFLSVNNSFYVINTWPPTAVTFFLCFYLLKWEDVFSNLFYYNEFFDGEIGGRGGKVDSLFYNVLVKSRTLLILPVFN